MMRLSPSLTCFKVQFIAVLSLVAFSYSIGCTNPVVDFNESSGAVSEVKSEQGETELESSSSSDSSDSEAEDTYCSFASASHNDRLPEVIHIL